jgi:hypothetical protein
MVTNAKSNTNNLNFRIFIPAKINKPEKAFKQQYGLKNA